MEALQFSTFVWPNNPETYRMRFRREYEMKSLAGGSWSVTLGGRVGREIVCEGVFYGDTAHDSFGALTTLFLSGTIGVLIHPRWDRMRALIAELEALEEPKENFVRYRILFVEIASSS